ncbi:TPA: hypothetical protein P2R06_000411 [Aeromonas veronii]|nr:hypothetical protein [Aeromonas veronii]
MPNKRECREECREECGELEHREREGVLQQGVGRGVLVALWLGIAASPLLLLVAATMLLGWLSLGDQGLLHYWQPLLLAGGVTGALVGGWLAERVRLRHGLLAFYARLMNNPELNR